MDAVVEEEEEEEEEEQEEEQGNEKIEIEFQNSVDTPMTSISSTSSDANAPHFIDTRHDATKSSQEPKSLYTVLQSTSGNMKGFLGSAHGYVMPSASTPGGSGTETPAPAPVPVPATEKADKEKKKKQKDFKF